MKIKNEIESPEINLNVSLNEDRGQSENTSEHVRLELHFVQSIVVLWYFKAYFTRQKVK